MTMNRDTITNNDLHIRVNPLDIKYYLERISLFKPRIRLDIRSQFIVYSFNRTKKYYNNHRPNY